ncbi:ABC transporter substrate-binding protein [Cupriavidus oxalaticus]|uniref:ABC transporter substrate-binding protein n=1 Tax=Cupriavidus oxalaticus TaxID=96344 RepID=A0A375FRG6_9BURK|nr:ABC transporter substrate-binding protein [Cupriavidus oxalaticus]QRQ85862.1 ABC transporter substrate-binding protein [Cupriavidus oxalaticus]QRQ95812.1 ABC transporter substrate-binding protein [Cupriavidus oxalaticus]WQD84486.1 ABC transporter substrate-binding protein [Cupriavidus oxalaticus]SPC06602.1 ABC-type branched-chain amino acid transport system, periplasmic component [Cupriavidus oxalaticus]SPC12418.1 ABC-type branched-chain amino acid transport system, periplasmic component [C
MNHVNASRRKLLCGSAATLAAAAVSPPLMAQPSRPIRIGLVSPQTGPLAAFGEADRWSIQQIMPALEKRGAPRVEILLRDSQSNPNRAGEVANALILKDKIDLMVVSSTPETTNPVSDACELNGVPCISTMAPWQPWFFGRGGTAERGFKWTYHFFWGLEDVIEVFTNMWAMAATNKKVGGLFPNDSDGNAWGDRKLGLPPALARKGFALVDPGRYQNMTQSFASHLSAFRRESVDIVTGVVIPPDMKTFLTQARQQNFRPKVISVAKAMLYPTTVEALGDLAEGITTEVWWTPWHPYRSSLTGQSAADLAGHYEQSTGRQWTQPIGFVHALLEVAVDVIRRARDPGNRAAIRDALAQTDLNTVVGPIRWQGGPVGNVAKTGLVGGQWKRGAKRRFELTVVSNQSSPQVPVGGKLIPL